MLASGLFAFFALLIGPELSQTLVLIFCQCYIYTIRQLGENCAIFEQEYKLNYSTVQYTVPFVPTTPHPITAHSYTHTLIHSLDRSIEL